MFPWFFIFLIVLCCFHIWNSRHLNSLLLAYRWGILFKGEKWRLLVTQLCLTLYDPMDCSLCSWNSPGKNTGVGSHSFPQKILLTQGLNFGLLHCRQILYCLSHQRQRLCFGIFFVYDSTVLAPSCDRILFLSSFLQLTRLATRNFFLILSRWQ